MQINQDKYWDSVAFKKTFSHPIIFTELNKYISKDNNILDLGCGYGRSLSHMHDAGFKKLIGIDSSLEMLKRAKIENPVATYYLNTGYNLPILENSIDAVLLLAVLTCIPISTDQKSLILEIERVLSSKGIIYLSDFYLNTDERNVSRYDKFQEKYGSYGVFELDEGVILRHHTHEWFNELFCSFSVLWKEAFPVVSMNGNNANAIRIILRKND
jgi:ubiquinone/menaquinone biosynthesis C-methylase UbiE